MEQRKSNIIQRLDWVTVLLYALLVTLGWINIYSAVYSGDTHDGFSFATRYGKQLIWIAAAFLIILTALVIDSKFYSTFAEIIYAFIVILLIGVLIFGVRINGAKSWIVMGPVQLQPAEFAKIAASLALAKFMSRYHFKPESFRTFLIVSAICFTPTLLILIQNDTGSALVFFALLIAFFREGMPPVYLLIGLLAVVLFILALLLPLYVVIIIVEIIALTAFFIKRRNQKELSIAAGILAVASGLTYLAFYLFNQEFEKELPFLIAFIVSSLFFLYYSYKHRVYAVLYNLAIVFGSILFIFSVDYLFDHVLTSHQKSRINHLLGIESDLQGAGYNVNQSMIAIGSGGFSGKGYLQGTQTKFKFVPEQSTDFIFCTVGEEWGFLGTLLVIGLFTGLLIRLIFLAERQKSKFSRIYGYCVASILFFHIAINIGMTIGLAPVIGIPLPFFSYGGSSLWGFTFLLFAFLKLDTNRTELIT